MNITVLGVDLAKNVFRLHGANERRRPVLRRKVRRSRLLRVIAAIPRCVIGMEACSGANYWCREFERLGHDVRIAYVRSNKNDAADAEAIAEDLSSRNQQAREGTSICGLIEIKSKAVPEKKFNRRPVTPI